VVDRTGRGSKVDCSIQTDIVYGLVLAILAVFGLWLLREARKFLVLE
jgi:hypothetical protein